MRKSGFEEAVQSLIGLLYCDPTQPHNMNVVIQAVKSPTAGGTVAAAAKAALSDAPAAADTPDTANTADGPALVTHVYGMERAAPRAWAPCDTTTALRLMLEEHGDAIRNFPDEPGVAGTMPQRVVDSIENAYEAGEYINQPDLARALAGKVQTSVEEVRARLMPYRQLMMAPIF